VELGRLLVALAWVAGGAAAGLGVLGAVPGWLVGEGSGVRPVASLEEAERRLAARLAVPAYFPSRLAWPPVDVRIAGGRGGAAAYRLQPRSGQGPGLELIQATVPGEPIPPGLLGDPVELGLGPAAVGDLPAWHARVLVGGAALDELRWEREGRAMVLRTGGDLEEAHRMARSARREGPP
jgi:hypothetical protein